MGSLYLYVLIFPGQLRLTSLSPQAGLLSAVLAVFAVPQIQNLRADPTSQSVYFQGQSVQILDRISQQLASVGSQIPTNFTPASPYPTFHPSASDRRANIFWLISLVCSLSAAILATLVQQWARAYMRIFQHSNNPLKTARIRQFLFEGAESLPVLAEAVHGLIHISVILFFWGLGDVILQIDVAVFVGIVAPIAVCACLYLYCVVAPIWNPQSPYRTPFSDIIWYLIRKLHHSGKLFKLASVANLAARREQFAMKGTEDRIQRDVRAIHWLVDKINGSNETETLVLSIPGSLNQKWGRDVWEGVAHGVQSASDVNSSTFPGLPSPREGITVYDLCRSVRYLFENYSNEGDSMDKEEQRRRMRGSVETVASLVCCAGIELTLFGEVGEVLSAVGNKEQTSNPLTITSNPLFVVRWTCLSLVAIRIMLDDSRLQELAKFALDGIARFQGGEVDTINIDTPKAAQRIDDYLKKTWADVVDLHLAFEPWSQNRTESDIREILKSREESVMELERIANEAVGVEDTDWRISLLRNAMDKATHKLTRRLPGVYFSELKPPGSIMLNEDFDLSSVETTLVPPLLIFPGQQVQSLCTLGRRLRDIIEGQNTEQHDETLRSLESLSRIPIPFQGFNYLPVMKRQMWRLLDLRDGGGLGFTIELFFLALRQLPSLVSLSELKREFYAGTFMAITSNWEKSKHSNGTQRVLLDILCDLVIRRRGVFSDFSYPPYIVDMLLDLVGKMVKGHGGEYPHINDVIQELEDENLWNRMDNRLREEALRAIGVHSPTTSYPPTQPSTFITPFHSSPPVRPFHGTPIVVIADQPSHSAAPPPDSTVPFPEPQLTRSRASNVPRGGEVRSPPPPSSFPSHFDTASVESHLEHYHSTVPLPESRVSFPS